MFYSQLIHEVMKKIIINIQAIVAVMMLTLLMSCDEQLTGVDFPRTQVSLSFPVEDSHLVMDLSDPDEQHNFEWASDNGLASYSLVFSLNQNMSGNKSSIYVGVHNSVILTTSRLDSALSALGIGFMEPADVYWTVELSNPKDGWCDDIWKLSVTKNGFPNDMIVLLESPANGASYELDYATPNTVLANIEWYLGASQPGSYAIEYSLSPDMGQSSTKALDENTELAFTHKLLDDMLSDLKADYLTKTVYWRIVHPGGVDIRPSEIKNLSLVGMLKPLVDRRDPNNPETYHVVKIGDNFWLGENLRAHMYADGSPLPHPYKTIGHSDATFVQKVGGYYSWFAAVNTTVDDAIAKNVANIPIQGACPIGWHIPSRNEYEALIQNHLGVENGALAIKDPNYWYNKASLTNSTNLNIVASGYYWLYNLPDNDILELWQPNGSGDLRAGFWTSSPLPGANEASLFLTWDWSQNVLIAATHLEAAYTLRCVRTQD